MDKDGQSQLIHIYIYRYRLQLCLRVALLSKLSMLQPLFCSVFSPLNMCLLLLSFLCSLRLDASPEQRMEEDTDGDAILFL